MADRYYQANKGVGLAAGVTEATTAQASTVELRVTYTSFAEKVDVLKAIDAIRDRIVQGPWEAGLMNSASVALITNGSASSAGKQWPGGRGFFAVKATFGGGSVALHYMLPDGVTYVAYATALTADGGIAFELPPCLIKAVVVTATAVYAQAARIPS